MQREEGNYDGYRGTMRERKRERETDKKMEKERKRDREGKMEWRQIKTNKIYPPPPTLPLLLLSLSRQ